MKKLKKILIFFEKMKDRVNNIKDIDSPIIIIFDFAIVSIGIKEKLNKN